MTLRNLCTYVYSRCLLVAESNGPKHVERIFHHTQITRETQMARSGEEQGAILALSIM